jgi:hypothetical protein
MLSRSTARVLVLIAILSTRAYAVTTDQIDKALEKAKNYIYSQQKDDNWEQPLEWHGDQSTGQTALAVYALLANGENPQDPRIVKAVEYLKKTPTTGVYALGVRCQVWLFMPQTPDNKQAMAKDARQLVDAMIKQGEGRGFYDYNPTIKNYSLSRAQYAVLGVWAAAQTGFEVPTVYWNLVEKSWIAAQDPSGGWSYLVKPNDKYPLTPGMTAVGVATLFITQDYLHANKGVGCNGNIRNPNIDKGLAWIEQNYDRVAAGQFTSRDFPYSTLYSIERIGTAGGLKYIKGIDWYQRGAEYLLSKQLNDGAWPQEFGDLRVSSTALAMLFLSRGGAPVLINKLDYTTAENPGDAHWNQRPRDVANVVRWIGRSVERDLNWQVVNLDAPLPDLHEAPILFMAGNKPLNLPDEAKQKLRTFIESGGLVVANADCQAREFSDSFRKLGRELFPTYEFRELPEGHTIYTAQQYRRDSWKTKPSVLALSNGVRELMILVPLADPARSWQLQLQGGRDELWQLMSNIALYSIDRRFIRNKGERYLVERDSSISPERAVPLLRIRYEGNWDPEPGGWRRIADLMHNQHKVNLDVRAGGATDDWGQAKLAHMTGTTKFKFDAVMRARLQHLIDAGGTIIIDAAGGSLEFVESAEQELASLFPGLEFKPVPASDPALAGDSPLAVHYRPHAQRVVGSLKDAHRLQVLEKDGRAIVYFSRDDISGGLVGHHVDGIVGYMPETATQLMTRLILNHNQ